MEPRHRGARPERHERRLVGQLGEQRPPAGVRCVRRHGEPVLQGAGPRGGEGPGRCGAAGAAEPRGALPRRREQAPRDGVAEELGLCQEVLDAARPGRAEPAAWHVGVGHVHARSRQGEGAGRFRGAGRVPLQGSLDAVWHAGAGVAGEPDQLRGHGCRASGRDAATGRLGSDGFPGPAHHARRDDPGAVHGAVRGPQEPPAAERHGASGRAGTDRRRPC